MIGNKDYMSELITYIRKNLKKGYTKEALRQALLGQGHSKTEIAKAMKRVEEELAKQAPVLKTKPEIKYEVIDPKDVKVEKVGFWKRLFS